ncbi:MAG: hypothetical protein JSS87_09320 [Acidobacteria bacterium]|nr:hypothetical protein [Acidobacteriota bacterium]
MHLVSGLLFFSLSMTSLGVHAQTAPGAPASAPQYAGISGVLQPALASVRHAVETARPDKWKISNSLEDETIKNIHSIEHDMDATLPQLLSAADTRPVLLSHVLPATRNVDALYNVLLRVAATAKVAAPNEQTAMLEDAVAQLQEAKRVLEDRVREQAAAEEKRVNDLQVSLKASQDALAKAQADAAAATAKSGKKKSAKSSRRK